MRGQGEAGRPVWGAGSWACACQRSAQAPAVTAEESSPAWLSKQPPSQSCSRPTTSVPPAGMRLPRPRRTDHTCRWRGGGEEWRNERVSGRSSQPHSAHTASRPPSSLPHQPPVVVQPRLPVAAAPRHGDVVPPPVVGADAAQVVAQHAWGRVERGRGTAVGTAVCRVRQPRVGAAHGWAMQPTQLSICLPK